MSDESTNQEMEELLKKRVEILKEKEELLKERKAIANQGPVPEVQRPKDSPLAPAKRAEDLMSSVNGNIFQGEDKGKKEGATEKKETVPNDEAGFFGRRGFLRTLLVTFGFSALTLVSAFVLSYPRLEKLAYVQFGALFENGSITLKKQLYKAIENEDWATVQELTDEDGLMEQQLIQPIMFWATTSVEDPQDLKEGGAGSYIAAVQETLTGAQASIDLIYEAADKKDKVSAQKGWAGLKNRANSFVRLANQRMPEELMPLSEIK